MRCDPFMMVGKIFCSTLVMRKSSRKRTATHCENVKLRANKNFSGSAN